MLMPGRSKLSGRRVSSGLFTLERLERIDDAGSHRRHQASGEPSQNKDTRHGRKYGEVQRRRSEQESGKKFPGACREEQSDRRADYRKHQSMPEYHSDDA